MTTYTFKVFNNDIKMSSTPGSDISVATYLQNLNQDHLQSRFFCDIVKDSQTDTKVDKILDILKNCFSAGNNDNIPSNKSSYHQELIIIEKQLDGLCKTNETVLKNVLKTDTIGSNTQISYAVTAFWESGFGIDKVCVDRNVNSIKTSAAVLDPISKDPGAQYYNPNVIFDNTFVTRLGFVGISQWSSKQSMPDANKSDVEIIFNSDIPPVSLQGIVTKDDRGIFAKYCDGNNEKNNKINTLYTPPSSQCDEIVKYLVIKELGDVAQVWMYLAYVCIQDQETDRTKSVMVTTDNVVYTLCKLLRLSCINTGSRQGVLSGHCTLKHYLAGAIDYNNKFKVMIKQQSERILQHNQATLNFFSRMSNKVFASDLQYFIEKRGKTVPAYVIVPPSTENDLTALAQTYIGWVTTLTDTAQSIYNKYDKGATNFADDVVLNSEYDKFFGEIIKCMCKQYFTKLPSNKYVILNTDDLLSKILDIIYAGDPTKKPKITDADFAGITNYSPGTTISASSSGGANKRIQSSKSGGGGDFSYDSQDYYVCVVLCYTKYILEKEIETPIDVFQYPTNIFFAVKYNQIAYEIEKTGFKGFVDFYAFFEKITDDEIMTQGNDLSTLVYLAGDIGETDEDNTMDISILSGDTTSSSPYSSFFDSSSFSPPSNSSSPSSPPSPGTSTFKNRYTEPSTPKEYVPFSPERLERKFNSLSNENNYGYPDIAKTLFSTETNQKKNKGNYEIVTDENQNPNFKKQKINHKGKEEEVYGGKNKKTRANKIKKTKNIRKTRKIKKTRKTKKIIKTNKNKKTKKTILKKNKYLNFL